MLGHGTWPVAGGQHFGVCACTARRVLTIAVDRQYEWHLTSPWHLPLLVTCTVPHDG